MRLDCVSLFSAFSQFGVVGLPDIPPLPSLETKNAVPGPLGSEFSLMLAEQLATDYLSQVLATIQDGPTVPPSKSQPKPISKHEMLRIKGATILSNISKFHSARQRIDSQVLGVISTCIVELHGCIPSKISPLVRSMMDALQFETHRPMQSRIAEGISRLIKYNVDTKPVANNRMISKIAEFLCCDLSQVGDCRKTRETEGIITLMLIQKEEAVAKLSKQKSGRTKKDLKKLGSDAADIIETADVVDEETQNALDLCHRGASMAFREIFSLFGNSAFVSCPKLVEVLFGALSDGSLAKSLTISGDQDRQEDVVQRLLDSLFILSTCASYLHQDLHGKLESIVKPVCETLKHPLSLLRKSGAKCLSVVTKVVTVPAMQIIVDYVLPLLSDSKNLAHRQGAAEAVYHLIGSLEDSILPYIIFLIIPILGRMSDPDEGVRFLSTHVFAQLIKLVPLESGVPNPEGISQELIDQRIEERKFLGQLVGSEKVEDFELCVDIKAELRPYQKEGVSWLAFLNRFGLHGILCDGIEIYSKLSDMGLGKTLQSICMLASDHHLRAEKYQKTQSPDSIHTPSLVVCPPTLVQHWFHEIKNFAPFIKSCMYFGLPADRRKLLSSLTSFDVVITSYDVVRNDFSDLSVFDWNYCILDEGYVLVSVINFQAYYKEWKDKAFPGHQVSTDNEEGNSVWDTHIKQCVGVGMYRPKSLTLLLI